MFKNLVDRITHLSLTRLSRQGAIVGSAALLFALLLYLIETEITAWVFGGIVVGVIGIGSWILLAPQEIQEWLSGRQVYHGTGTVLISVVVIGIAATGYRLWDQEKLVFDLTPYSTYTLDDTSLRAVARVKNRLEGTEFKAQIVAFYPREAQRERALADIILTQFENEGDGFIEVVYYDPDVDLVDADYFGYGSTVLGEPFIGPLFLTYIDSEGNRPAISTFEIIGEANERNISTALLRLATAGQYTIYFTSGHLEFDPTDTGSDGISEIFQVLSDRGININTINLSLIDEIPANATAIVIASPRLPFTQVDIDKIDAYLKRGGHVLITSDPPFLDNPAEFSNNEFLLEGSLLSNYLWNTYGVRFRDDIVSDPDSSVDNDLNLLIQQFAPFHPALINFPALPVIFELARSTEVQSAEFIGASPYVIEEMIFTSNAAFGERGDADLGVNHPLEARYDRNIAPDRDDEISGQLSVAISVRLRQEGEQEITPRLMLIGDTDWLRNGDIRFLEGHIVLWGRIVDWLVDDSELSLPAAQIQNDLIPVVVTNRQQDRISLITFGVLPGIVLAVGVLVWGTRRRQ